MSTTLDLFEYTSDANAQAAYVTNGGSPTGGTITTDGNYTVHTFTSDGTFSVTKAGNVEVLVVAGGGSGGGATGDYGAGGGGGAGGYETDTEYGVVAGDYSITVGAGATGGAGATSGDATNGATGGDSVFGTITCKGGGAGKGAQSSAQNGGDGGSGGGGAGSTGTATGGAALGTQGNAGGDVGNYQGGGGGGKGGAGSGMTAGAGQANDISGASVTYSAGGRGWDNNESGTPAAGGDPGDGGDGGTNLAGVRDGKNGANGVVIIRYLTSDFSTSLQSYSESTIKTQGSYSLKGIATTDALNKTLTRTIGSPIDLSGVDTLRFDIYSSRTGSNIKIGIHDSGGTTTETTPNITGANAWQTVAWDISAVADADKNAIDSIIITIVNADSANTFYIDNFLTAEDVSVTAEPFIITTSLSSLGGIVVDGLGFVYEESTSGSEMDVSLRTNTVVMKDILHRKNLKYIYHRINSHGKDVTMTVYIDGVAQTPTFTINTTTLTTRRIEDIPDIWEGKRFDIELSCVDVTDTDLEIYAPLVMRFTSVGG